MRAINHALTGSLIGLITGEPAIAVPAAVASHYVLDAIPHHGHAGPEKSKLKMLRGKLFRNLIYADAMFCGVLVLILAADRPFHWLLAAICAFAAAAPDFLSVKRYMAALRGRRYQPGLYCYLAGKIQWFERPIGAVVEVTWFVGAILLLTPLLK